VEQAAAASESLKSQAQRLLQTVSVFVTAPATRAAPALSR
jgi:hypothetical protein